MVNRLSRLLRISTGVDAGADTEILQPEGKLERTAHFWSLAIRHFLRNRCLIRASALAYTTLLALIPLLAVIVSISTSLLKNVNEDKFYAAVASLAPASSSAYPTSSNTPASDQPTPAATNSPAPLPSSNNSNLISLTISNELAGTNNLQTTAHTAPRPAGENTIQKEVAHWLRDFVQNTQGTTLGVTGTLAFVGIAIMMLSRIEETFNDIWGVARGRSWLTRVVLYWATITLGPLLILTAMSLAGGSQVQAARDFCQHVPLLGNVIFKLVPLVVLWLTFALIYQIVPNTKVQFSAALAGGFVAGTLWHLNNVFGFLYVSNAIRSSGMYGTVGLVPIFMLGLYFSWAILLFGAQVAYAYQNRAAYLQDRLADNVNHRGREFVALRIMTLVAQRFNEGLKPASGIQIATELGVPSRLTQQILRTLASANLVIEVGGLESGYAPARPINTINIHHILHAMRAATGRDLAMADLPAVRDIYGEFSRIEEAERQASERLTLLDLAQRIPSRPVLPLPAEGPVEKHLTESLVVEEISKSIPAEPMVTAPVAEPTPEMVPETASLAESAPSHTTPTIAPAPLARREVTQPEERDFPL